MPSDFPRSPKLLKGALVVFETVAPVPTNLIVFQYNPDGMTRGFRQLGGDSPASGGGDTQSAFPPLETFQLRAELDASDQLESPSENPLTSWRRPASHSGGARAPALSVLDDADSQ